MRNYRCVYMTAALSVFAGCQSEVETTVDVASEALCKQERSSLRDYIAQQVGGLDKLKVPQNIPLPPADRTDYASVIESDVPIVSTVAFPAD